MKNASSSTIRDLVACSALAGACGVGAVALTPARGGPSFVPLAAAAAGMGVASGLLIVLILRVALRRAFTAWTRSVADAALDGAGPEAMRRDSEWIVRGLANACRPLADAWRADDQKRQASARELEIRQRLSDDARAHFEAVLQCLHDAVIITDAFNDITLINSAARQLLGVPPSASAFRSIDELVRDPMIVNLVKEAAQAGVLNKRTHVEYTPGGSAGDGEGAHPTYDATALCIPGRDGAISGVVTIIRDITREREINRMKSEFVSQASHELRTPLSSINAYIELLMDGEMTSEEQRTESYQVIKSETDRVTRMIDTMLNISRIEAGITQPEYSEIDLHKLAEEAAAALTARASAKKLSLTVAPTPLPCTANADRDMVFQVFVNLIGNAIKYTPDGGRITVNIENDETSRGVLVTVSDTGLGIPPDSIDKIFDKFYRIDSYRRIAPGTGLGLNLVRHIVETVHRGNVGVTSEVGMGSKFWFTIPYDGDTAPARKAA